MDEIVNWDEFLEVLEQFEWTPSHQVEGGKIYAPSAQLEEVLADSDWHQSDWYSDDAPEGIGRYTLLAMNWESHGAPISFDGFLEFVQVGDEAAYVFYSLEGVHDTPELLAKIVPAQTPAAYRKLFLEIMSSDDNFLVLPDYITNGSPELLDQATIRQGFWETMQRVEGQYGVGWPDLWQKLERPVRGLVHSSREEQPEEGAPPLSEAERNVLLDRYFEKHYEEDSDE